MDGLDAGLHAELPTDAAAGDQGPAAPATVVKMPAVAAIVCNFNQRPFVAAAIASVAQQTYPYLECVVVDDCSTDGSGEVVARVLAHQCTRKFKFIRHSRNLGQMAAMMSGLDATEAPFVAWIDADDIWFPEHIERHIAHHLNTEVNAAITTSNMVMIDADGTIVAGADPSMSPNSPVRSRARTAPVAAAALGPGCRIDFSAPPRQGPVFVARNYESWIWSPTSGMVFRRATLEAIRPLDASRLRICADNYLARFGHLVGGTIWMSETLGCYRVHGTNGFAKRAVYGDASPVGITPRSIMLEGDLQILGKMFERGGHLSTLLPARHRRHALRRIARKEEVLRHLVGNKSFMRRLPFRYRMRLRNRFIVERVRRIFGKKTDR